MRRSDPSILLAASIALFGATQTFAQPLCKPVSAAWRRWHGDGKSLRALAELDDGQLSNLSETGRRLRCEARRRAQHARRY